MSRIIPSARPRVEAMEPRDMPSATPLPELVGVVRGGRDWFLAGETSGINAAEVRRFGSAGAHYLSGDWNGDGRLDLIAVSPNAQGGLTWRYDLDANGAADGEHFYGLAGDRAFVGDWNGDGRLDVGVARNNVFGGIDWFLDTTRQTYANPTPRQWGLHGDTPVVGDWDGNGTTDVGAVSRDPASGMLVWRRDAAGAFGGSTRSYGLLSTNDAPVVGDWDGDGRDDLGVTRNNPATGLKEWWLDTNGDVFADVVRPFGFHGDTPVTGSWSRLAAVPRPVNPVDPVDPTDRLEKASGYRALPSGAGVNLRPVRMGYNATGGAAVGLTVLVTNPNRRTGGFAVRLYWVDDAGRRTLASKADKKEFKATTPVWGPNTNVGVRFARNELTARPARARYLVAVVDPANATGETNERDNVFTLRL